MNLEKLIILAIILAILTLGESDPEIVVINQGGSQYNVTNLSDFNNNLNATFAQLRDELNAGKYFATAEQPRGSDSAYSMVQCRKYLSSADCIACFTAAESLIRKFSPANGARVVYLGCSLSIPNGIGAGRVGAGLSFPFKRGGENWNRQRLTSKSKNLRLARDRNGQVLKDILVNQYNKGYESSNFFDQSTQEGRFGSCGNQTASDATAFQTAVSGLLADLQVATPKINGFFAASKRAVGESSNEVYAIAQCVESISESGCRDCLQVAYGNINRCLTSTVGWAVDVGCFLRFSESPFFADNQTTDITPFLKTGGSSKKKAIIGGTVAGGISLLLIALFLWLILSRKRMITQKGNILDATELQGPINYRYKDLVSATRKFSEENKLGEGGFGEIYKAWKLYENDLHLELIDESLDPNEYTQEEAKKAVEIALMCTQASAASRPTMSEVVVLLRSKGSLENKPIITRPTFIDPETRVRGESSTSTNSPVSNATASITDVSGR
ncbi:hypothetical protein Pint_18330 [Pistacia integerrima]|uniref:Uncharacterized protein n=1 Tax=Pistacia integerrima TaxID=434235 RepID=A0ACC0YX21_9ROSI|nr:hypothetical protein Pint_18330 [Pistacia integerrima]